MIQSSYNTHYTGAHNVRVDEPFRTIVDATEYYIHPGWDNYNSRNDIALIKLPTPVNFTGMTSITKLEVAID